jgi:hypothetical protein
LQGEITINQFWPLDPRFNLDHSALAIQIEYLAQLPDIHQQGVGTRTAALPSHVAHRRLKLFSDLCEPNELCSAHLPEIVAAKFPTPEWN